jgi:hypothetical protein
MKRLIELTACGGPGIEPILTRIFLGSAALNHVSLSSMSFSDLGTMLALCRSAESLENLTTINMHCRQDALSIVGSHCFHLTGLNLGRCSKSDEPRWITESGLLVIAQGCRKLRYFTVMQEPAVTEAVLLAFAAHCHELVEVLFIDCAIYW